MSLSVGLTQAKKRENGQNDDDQANEINHSTHYSLPMKFHAGAKFMRALRGHNVARSGMVPLAGVAVWQFTFNCSFEGRRARAMGALAFCDF